MPKLIQTWFSLRELVVISLFALICGICVGQFWRIKQIEPTLDKEIGLAYIENEYAWVGLEFDAETITGKMRKLKTVSAPLFITKTVILAQEG